MGWGEDEGKMRSCGGVTRRAGSATCRRLPAAAGSLEGRAARVLSEHWQEIVPGSSTPRGNQLVPSQLFVGCRAGSHPAKVVGH